MEREWTGHDLSQILDTDIFRSIVQSIATVIGGSILGLVYVWKVALVGMGQLMRHFALSHSLTYLTSLYTRANLDGLYPTGQAPSFYLEGFTDAIWTACGRVEGPKEQEGAC